MYINIPENVEKCINKLNEAGFEAFIVGGCVRDSIIGRVPSDWDVCTSALPQETKEVFKDFKTIDIGREHGTIAVIYHKDIIEITTYRIDGEYRDNRRPDNVEFTFKIEDDLSRRDFTINAMAYNKERGLVDFFYGKVDIEKKIVRCVGEPNRRFNEDALRIMRAFRFAAQLNYLIEEKTLNAMKEAKELLRNISVERIVVELNKLLMSEQPKNMIRLLFEMDIFKEIIEFMHNCNLKVDNFKDFTENCGQIIENSPQDLSIRLCILLNYIIEAYEIVEKDNLEKEHEEKNNTLVEKILRALKYDNKTIKEVSTLSLYYDRELICDKVQIKRILNLVDINVFNKLILMKKAIKKEFNVKEYKSVLKSIEENKECYRIKDLKINGSNLINLGIKDRKAIGQILNAILNMVIENPTMNNHEKLMELGEKLVQCI